MVCECFQFLTPYPLRHTLPNAAVLYHLPSEFVIAYCHLCTQYIKWMCTLVFALLMSVFSLGWFEGYRTLLAPLRYLIYANSMALLVMWGNSIAHCAMRLSLHSVTALYTVRLTPSPTPNHPLATPYMAKMVQCTLASILSGDLMYQTE